jgi:hypothetical protein
MAVTIEELDTTVRTFYEGRGDQVRLAQPDIFALVMSEAGFWF